MQASNVLTVATLLTLPVSGMRHTDVKHGSNRSIEPYIELCSCPQINHKTRNRQPNSHTTCHHVNSFSITHHVRLCLLHRPLSTLCGTRSLMAMAVCPRITSCLAVPNAKEVLLNKLIHNHSIDPPEIVTQ
jgi:hypothetical protein